MRTLFAWLRREWAMLKSYRRPHVYIRFNDCIVYGTLDVADVAAKLTDPRITRANGRDVSIMIEHCVFEGDGTNTAIRA